MLNTLRHWICDCSCVQSGDVRALTWDLLRIFTALFLVVAAERDGFTPISCAQKIANQIPDSSLVVLADGCAALIEQPEIKSHKHH